MGHQERQDDDRIKALVIKPQRALQGTSFSKLQEVASRHRRVLLRAANRSSPWPTYYSQGAYLLAAHADHALLSQSGAVPIEGLGVYQTYFKSALESSTSPHVFKVGTTNPSSSPIPATEMSPRARRRTSAGWISCGNPMWPTWLSSGDRTGCRGTEQPDRFLELLHARPVAMPANYAPTTGRMDQLPPATR